MSQPTIPPSGDIPSQSEHFAELFQAAMESSLDAFMILNPVIEHDTIVDWEIEYMNDRASKIFPMREGVAIGKRVRDMWGDSLALGDFQRMYERVHRDGTAHEDEFSLTFSDDRRIWIRRQVVPVGQRVAITTRDITAVHNQETELRESQQMYRTFIENAAEGVWALDAERRTTFVNARMATMLGYSPEEMIGQHVDVFTPESERNFAANRFEMMRGGLVDTYDRPCLDRDGSIVWVELSTTQILDDNGVFIGSFGFACDQTRRHTAEEALRESEDRYRTIVETTSEGIIACDRDGFIVLTNSTACDILGQTSDQLAGTPVADVLAANVGENVTDRYREAVRSTRTFLARSELHLTRPDGSPVWVDVRAATLGGSTTQEPGVLIALTDVSDRRAADEARNELSTHLAIAEARQRATLADDLHDGAIQSLAAIALRLGTLRRSAQHAGEPSSVTFGELESDVLSTVRELRSILFELAPPDPENGGFTRALNNLANAILGETEVIVRVTDLNNTPVPQAAAAVLLRVAREALSNVIRHANATDVSLSVESDSERTVMRITDNGVGFDIPTIRNSPGHFGLAAMASRARSAGGTVEFVSTATHGTTIVASIPH